MARRFTLRTTIIEGKLRAAGQTRSLCEYAVQPSKLPMPLRPKQAAGPAPQ
jgi:hypothetical protein